MNKAIYLLFGIILYFLPSISAQKLIALQHNGATSLFTTIPAAVATAVSGDTIYLSGGTFPGFAIDKKLVIIGVGHNPDSTAATGITLISSQITLNDSNCDGSVFTGLRVDGILNLGQNDNVQILRCLITGSGIRPQGSENWTITECIVTTIQTPILNSFVSNNLFVEGTAIPSASNCQIDNNIFLNNANNSITCNSCIVNNNIFHRFSHTNSTFITNCLFNNNIFSVGDIPNSVFGNGNIGTGNIYDANFDGLFTDFLYTTYGGNIANLYQFDLHLVNSTYNTGGTDGTPIGIYGGTFPWKDGSLPFNPRILFKSIANTTDQDGNLLINIQVEAQDH